MKLAVCMKWVDTRPEVDPLTGEVAEDRRWFAASRADQSALETALSITDKVTVVCAGPAESETMLRDSLAAGAVRAIRVDLDPASDSATVAAAVASVVTGYDLVVCGNWSLDRGSGSFPAFLAHELRVAQALGCTTVARSEGSGVTATRRLDRGRREQVRLAGPGVVSVEAGRELRRAGLRAVLAAGSAEVEIVAPPSPAPPASRVVAAGPYRPRSREIPAPDHDDPRLRMMAVSGAATRPKANREMHLSADEAADTLLELLRLDQGDPS